MLKQKRLALWRDSVYNYVLNKNDKHDAECKAFQAFHDGIKLDSAKILPEVAILVKKLTKVVTLNATACGGALAIAVDSAKPRNGQNLVKVYRPSQGLVEGLTYRVSVHGIFPEKSGNLYGVKLGKVIAISKSERKVPDTVREILNNADSENALFISKSDREVLESKKVLKKVDNSVHGTIENHPEQSLSTFSRTFNLFKADNSDKRLAYGVVYEPGLVDTDGDSADAQTIEDAAHEYLADYSDINLMHEKPLGNKVKVVESYIAPCDFVIGTDHIKKGSWVLAVFVDDENLWQAVKSKKINAFSLEGTGLPA